MYTTTTAISTDCESHKLIEYGTGEGPGVEKAWRILDSRLRPHLRNWLQGRYGFDKAKAEDLTQEILTRAAKHADNYDADQASVETWLFTIGSNLAANALRDRSRDPLLQASALSGDDDGVSWWEREAENNGTGPENRLQRREIRQAVEDAIDQLDPKFRTVMELRVFEDLSYAAISRRTGVQVGTVKSRLFRGRSRTKRYLRRRGIEPGTILE